MSYPLVVFDLDGTLIDSLADLATAVNRLVSEHGGRQLASGEVARMIGEGAALLVGRAIEASGAATTTVEALPRFLAIYESLLPGVTGPYPGIPQLLEGLAPACRLAVLTNKPTAATRKILDACDLSRHFFDVIGGDGSVPRKPDPQGLLLLAARAGVEPARTLMVGDSTVDLRTAHRAGTGMCVARYGFGQTTFDASELRGDEFGVDRPGEIAALVLPR